MKPYKLPTQKFDATGGQKISLADYAGKNIVLYFYPKDNTPGCTTEAKSFRDLHDQFLQENTVVIGVSTDSILSHDKFREKCALPFELISDAEETLCQHFDVLGQKSMFGKQYIGVNRSTLLIDSKGKVVKEWRKVKVLEHAKEVLDAVKALNAEVVN